jgi:hypothetical protein
MPMSGLTAIPDLLRSLHWGDPDYKGHVFDAVAHILSKNPDNVRKLLEYQPIAEWLKQNDAGAYQEPSAEAFGADVAEIISLRSSRRIEVPSPLSFAVEVITVVLCAKFQRMHRRLIRGAQR